MRFYRGVTYDFKTAVYPLGDYSYEILDVRDRNGRCGYIRFGFGREYKVGAASRIIMSREVNGKKRKRILKLPFVREDGRLVFDLPEYLTENGLRFKLYKRYSLHGGCGGSNAAIYCKNGSIAWGSEWCVDYFEYWLAVFYEPKASCMKLGGKKIRWLRSLSETRHTDTEPILGYFKQTMETPQELSYAELGRELDRIGLSKRSRCFEIRFCDGSIVYGKDIDWEDA